MLISAQQKNKSEETMPKVCKRGRVGEGQKAAAVLYVNLQQ